MASTVAAPGLAAPANPASDVPLSLSCASMRVSAPVSTILGGNHPVSSSSDSVGRGGVWGGCKGLEGLGATGCCVGISLAGLDAERLLCAGGLLTASPTAKPAAPAAAVGAAFLTMPNKPFLPGLLGGDDADAD